MSIKGFPNKIFVPGAEEEFVYDNNGDNNFYLGLTVEDEGNIVAEYILNRVFHVSIERKFIQEDVNK
jgi:hypothetical protein